MLYFETTSLIKQSQGHMLLNNGTDSLKFRLTQKTLVFNAFSSYTFLIALWES